MRWTALSHQLFLLLVVPAVLVVGTVAYLADAAARESLEEALASRLAAIAEAAGQLVGPRVTQLEAGDDDSRLAQLAVERLEGLRAKTGVGRIMIVTLDHEVLADTQRELTIGSPYLRARFDAPELERVVRGEKAASVLFEGKDGMPYKTGYAPLAGEDGAIIGYVAVEAAADYTEAIDELRATVASITFAGFLFLVLAATLSARRVAVPLSALSEAAEKIGAGRLDTEIPVGGPDEAIVLGTTMRKMTASLRARDEEMQLMLAGIAHEVRNPLGGIELFGGLLAEDLEKTDPRRKHVEKILRELGVLARVVNDFLDFARRKAHEPRPSNIHELLFEVVSLLEKEASDKRVKVALEVPAGLTFSVDPEAIKRALLNLVKNAIQAVPEEGRVVVSASVDVSLTLVVEDDGPGIPEEKRSEIFTPFFTTKQKGTGLGLALVKKTIAAHDGTIEVGASSLGGARFTVHLPAGRPGPTRKKR